VPAEWQFFTQLSTQILPIAYMFSDQIWLFLILINWRSILIGLPLNFPKDWKKGMEMKWIAFKDQMPQPYGVGIFVWCTEKNCALIAAIHESSSDPDDDEYIEYYLHFVGNDYGTYRKEDIDKFTHWMPIQVPGGGPE
jgi:hypothetical protein